MRSAVADDVAAALARLVERADLAQRAGLDRLVVSVAFDLGRCIWIGEDVVRLSEDPVENILLRCREYVSVLDFRMRALPRRSTAVESMRPNDMGPSVEQRTHTLYGTLWAGLRNDAVDEASTLLRTRLERNGLDGDALAGRLCLDAGCGSGRYTVALRTLGASSVVGSDLGLAGVVGARARAARAGVDGVAFCVGSVLRLPFSDGAFDFVMSNGVLHHTRDPMAGLRELRRVLRAGGNGWLYLYNSDGIYWTVRKAMRRMVASIPQDVTKAVLGDLRVLPNRVFLIMDSLYVPIEENYTREEVERMLATAGFAGWRFLARGADRDLSEAVHRGDPAAVEMYGAHGDLRFWLEG